MRSNPKKRMLLSAKQRAKRDGIPFDLTEDDLDIPDVCPVLGIPFGTNQWYDSPSLDKTIPELGYVKGNVAVISARANILKRDGTLKEFEALVSYLREQTNE